MNIAHEIETLIRARYPILYLLTSEELRVQSLLVELAGKRQKRLFEWSHTTGLVPAGTSMQSPQSRHAPTKDPLLALDQVMEQVEPAIFLFKDFHPFLTRGHHAVIRRLKEIALHLKNSFKTIVLVSSVLEVPVELEKEVTVLNFPLPTRDDLAGLLDKITGEMQAFPQVRIELDEAGRDRLLQAARLNLLSQKTGHEQAMLDQSTVHVGDIQRAVWTVGQEHRTKALVTRSQEIDFVIAVTKRARADSPLSLF